MSRRSRRARNVSKVGGIPLILLQVIVGALLAILLGVWLGKFYISRVLKTRIQPETTIEGEEEGEEEIILPPVGNEGEIPPVQKEDNSAEMVAPDSDDTLTARISPLQYHRVQVGAFGQEENAGAFLEELGELGFRGLISASGDMYRVSIGLFAYKSGAEEFIANLAPLEDVLAEEPLVIVETLPEAVLTYSSAEEECYEQIVQALGKTKELITEMESLWLTHITSGIATDQRKVEFDRMAREIGILSDAIQGVSPETTTQLWDEVCLLPGDLEATLVELRQQVAGGGKWMPFSQALARLIYLWPLLM